MNLHASRLGAIAFALVLALVLAACAEPTRLPPGAGRAEVLAQLGTPTAVYPLGPGERLQYSRAPMGTAVNNVDLDAAGKVVAVTQVLDENRFALDIQPGVWRQADVLRTYGRPEDITRVTSFDGTVWSWRYLQLNNRRLLFIYIDPAGVVQRYGVGDDLRFNNGPNRE